ncbi:MAG: YkgJ family cysteine cluster protein [Armatimonadetes bacterium]|nr:YkgJ family cysteine cluster protein [Armatimonadota bacterium]
MSQRDVHFPELNYDCVQCGKGCSYDWTISLEKPCRQNLEGSQAYRELRARGYFPLVVEGPDAALGRDAAGSCFFLKADHLCALHAELGFERKPLTCQQFPFMPVETPDGVYVGLSFFCTAVQRNHGRPVREHRLQIEAMLGDPPAGEPDGVGMAPGVALAWSEYMAFEHSFRTRLASSSDLESGLWSLAGSLVGYAKTLEGRSFRLSEWEDHPAPPCEEADEQGLWAFVASLVSIAEERDPQKNQLIMEALLENRDVWSPRLKCRIPTARVRERARVPFEATLEDHARRYVDHLIFRKILPQPPSVVAGVLFLNVLWRALKFYAALASLEAGREQVAEDDFFLALETVEARLATHARYTGPCREHLQTAVWRRTPACSTR